MVSIFGVCGRVGVVRVVEVWRAVSQLLLEPGKRQSGQNLPLETSNSASVSKSTKSRRSLSKCRRSENDGGLKMWRQGSEKVERTECGKVGVFGLSELDKREIIWLQLIELHPLNSSSSQFRRVGVTEVVDELMTESV